MKTKLAILQNSQNIHGLALALGYKASSISYILYKIHDDHKYTEFKIDKKSGGERTIQAPIPRLKGLQFSLLQVLYECLDEIQSDKISKNFESTIKRAVRVKSLSHGYERGLSIASNAELHKNKRYVLNLDIEDFFPSINFGRVQGYFVKNKNFCLHPKVANLIAQIVCHKGCLPQGSPCSPIISNLIAQILDMRLVALAKKYNCTYSRYADDITFSTNLKKFPEKIAYQKSEGEAIWVLGKSLVKCIGDAGFRINDSKTRMQYQDSRQVVTGLVVNKEVNVKKEYYRNARAMCHSLFNNGFYYLSTSDDEIEKETSFYRLEGILGYIFYIKKYRNKFSDKGYRISKSINKYPPEDRSNQYSDESHIRSTDGIKNLYANFLFFKHFYSLKEPLIWCEGKTDKVYIKYALKNLSAEYPELIENTGNKNKFNLKFFNHTKIVHETLNLAEGTSGMSYLMLAYKKRMARYKVSGKAYPVIMILDNDDGANKILNILKDINPSLIKKGFSNIDRNDRIFHVAENLYIVLTPRGANNSNSKIEDLFERKILETKLDGRTFNPENSSSDTTSQYSKNHFAEFVVKKHHKTIDFSGFREILNPIKDIISNYAS